jgi:hypothetical protein
MKSAPRSTKLKRGTIVEIEWFDCHSSDRLSLGEVDELDDPAPTVAYGLVLRNGEDYLTIASELGADPFTDGTWVEQIAHGSIRKVRVLGKRGIEPAQS